MGKKVEQGEGDWDWDGQIWMGLTMPVKAEPVEKEELNRHLIKVSVLSSKSFTEQPKRDENSKIGVLS